MLPLWMLKAELVTLLNDLEKSIIGNASYEDSKKILAKIRNLQKEIMKSDSGKTNEVSNHFKY